MVQNARGESGNLVALNRRGIMFAALAKVSQLSFAAAVAHLRASNVTFGNKAMYAAKPTPTHL